MLKNDQRGILSLTGEVLRLEKELRKRDALDAACAAALLRAEGAVAGMIERIAHLEAHRDALQATANRYLDRARRAESVIPKRRRWLHRGRGSHYQEIGRAELQLRTIGRPLREGDTIVVYQGYQGEKPKLWAREEREFEDGRFERLEDER